MDQENAHETDLRRLPPYQQRRFVPPDTDLAKLNELQDLYSQLLQRKIETAADFERWVLDRSELEAGMGQEGSILYIRMTCQTDDAQRGQDYKNFIENVVPAIKPLEDQLNKRHMDVLALLGTDDGRYGVYNREIRSDVELFVAANVDLETQVELLSQEYQSICGAMTVEYDGREQTLPQMSKYLLEPDRNAREAAWRSITRRRLKDSARLEKLFDDMLVLRHRIARNAGMEGFCAYKFKSLHRFDYTPQDCLEYHKTVERIVVPLWRQLLERRKKMMRLDCLRPWDTSVDPLGRAPLKPFTRVTDLIAGCQDIFHKVDPSLGRQFDQMIEGGLLDLESRKGKAPGGYQSMLDESRKPFIFMNAVGVDGDVRTLLHESGHAFHSFACAGDPLLDYRHGPMEFNEVASMSMELLGNRHLSVFYQSEDEQRSRQRHLEDIVFILVWVATIDAFQHWIYNHPGHDQNQRRGAWLDIGRRFGGRVVDWGGLEDEQATRWHQQLHIFEVPFYYIEYGIAQIGALQLWNNSKKDWAKTLAQYQHALSLGGSRPLPELFDAAGIRFDFSEATIAPLIRTLEKELNIT